MPGPGCEMRWGLSLESVGTLAGIGSYGISSSLLLRILLLCYAVNKLHSLDYLW